ncbi:MAG: hypothetical protein IJ389_06345 [Clostridia bacterium]|nr:hypothetical protein [Clostridia bacterium]MBQ8207712.1 hypothetical protein [Clostridia bacterium]
MIFKNMKKKVIKIASAILAAASVLAIAGCKSGSDYKYDPAADFRPEEGEIFADVPKGQYDGYVFRILNGKNGLPSSKIDAETISGNVLGDVIYERNRNVESRLNVVIEEVRDTPEAVYKTACQSVLAGDEDLYSAVWNSASYMASMAANGYLVSSDYLVEADYEKPWWNDRAMSDLSVDSQTYLLFSDIQLSYYDAHNLVGFNMEMIEKIDGAEDPYSLAETGLWTFDKMMELAQMAAVDENGDGAMESHDTFGLALDRTIALPMMFGCDVSMSGKDEYDLPYVTCINNEKFFDVYTLITDSLFDRAAGIYNSDLNEADDMSDIDMFLNERSLFIVLTVGELNELRKTEFEFGVVPMPKYSSDQKDYVSYISGKEVWAMGIPASGRNFLRTGIVLENLAAETWREDGVRDTYVNGALEFRYVNDDKSRANLKIVLESGRFDLCEVYGWGKLASIVEESASNASEHLMSTLASNEDEVRSAMNGYIEDITEFK